MAKDIIRYKVYPTGEEWIWVTYWDMNHPKNRNGMSCLVYARPYVFYPSWQFLCFCSDVLKIEETLSRTFGRRSRFRSMN